MSDTPRISRADLLSLREQLYGRDRAVLQQVADLKLMTGAQIQAVHFSDLSHATSDSAARASRRVLRRLVRDRLLVRLQRRVGGTRGGSAGYVYGVAEVGQRLLDLDGPRRRFREPSATFVTHTLAIAQVVVDLIGRSRAEQLELIQLQTEPRCWRHFRTIRGAQVVRPDLFVAVGSADYEYRWFIEMDLGTETMPRRINKCKQYEAYYQSGQEQADHGIVPRVLWCVPTPAPASTLRDRIARSRGLTAELFTTTTPADLLDTLIGDRA